MIQARHQHARRADLPHGRRRRARAAGDRRLRPEGRADRLQRRPLAAASRTMRTRASCSSTALTIGVVREYMDKSLFTEMDDETIDIVDRAVGDLAVARRANRRSRPERRVVRRLRAPVRPAALQQAVHAAVPRALSRRRRGQADGGSHRDARRDGRGPHARARGVDAADDARRRGDGREPLHDEPLPRGARRRRDPQQRRPRREVELPRRPAVPGPPRRARTPGASEAARHVRAHGAPFRGAAARAAVHVADGRSTRSPIRRATCRRRSSARPASRPVNGRGNSWSMLGREGFPAITVPAGFTTVVYDRVRDAGAPIRADGGAGGDGATAEGTHVVGPTPAAAARRHRLRRAAVRRADAAAHRVGIRGRDEAPPSASRLRAVARRTLARISLRADLPPSPKRVARLREPLPRPSAHRDVRRRAAGTHFRRVSGGALSGSRLACDAR